MRRRSRIVARTFAGVAALSAGLAFVAPATQAGVAHYTELPIVNDLDPVAPLGVSYLADEGATAPANQLVVSVAAGSVVFTDPTAGAGAPTAECPVAVPLTCSLDHVLSLDIDLGAADDTIAVPASGLPATTTVQGGPGTGDRADYSAYNGAAIALDGTVSAGGVTFAGVEDATGSPGDDVITGGDGPNRLVGSGGTDTLNGGGGVDNLIGGVGGDHLNGGADDDLLIGGDSPEPDAYDGGAGNDRILAADGVSETIDCGDGKDSVAADFGDTGDLVNLDCETVTGLVLDEASTGSDPQGSPGTQQPAQAPASTDAADLARAPVPVLADVVPTPGDTKAPSARLHVPGRQRLTYVLRHGLSVPVGCSEACGISVAVLLDRATAKKYGLAGRSGPALVGTATGQAAKPGMRRLRVRLSPSARKALKGAKSIPVAIQTLVSDASGNGTLLQRRVTLHR